MIHKVKIKYRFYQQIKDGVKTFEIRKDDRSYKKGDKLHFILLDEIGSIINKKSDILLEITNVFQEKGFGLEEGYCILSFNLIK